MTRKIFFAALITSMVALSACNTVRGVGRDVSSAGDAVQNSTH